jgi:hypothetical protein
MTPAYSSTRATSGSTWRGDDFNLLGLAQLLGAVGTIAKPFTFEDMLKAVNEELSR